MHIVRKFKDFRKNCRDEYVTKKKIQLCEILGKFELSMGREEFYKEELLILPYFSEKLIEDTVSNNYGGILVSCKETYRSFWSRLFNRPSHIISIIAL